MTVDNSTGQLSLEEQLKLRLDELHAIKDKTLEQWEETIQTARVIDQVTSPVFRGLRALGRALARIEENKLEQQ
jgi:hypothetical protein